MNSALFFLQSDFGGWNHKKIFIKTESSQVCKVSNLGPSDIVSSPTVNCGLSSGNSSLKMSQRDRTRLLSQYLTFTESKGFLFLFAVFLQIFRWTSILSFAKLLLQRPHWANPGLGANFTPEGAAVFVLLVVKYCPADLTPLLSLFARLFWLGGFLCWYSCFPSCFRLLDTDILLGSWKGPIRDWSQEIQLAESEKYLYRNPFRRRLTLKFSCWIVSILSKFWFVPLCGLTQPFSLIRTFWKVFNWL